MSTTVTIDAGSVRGLAANAAVTAEFPFLRAYAAKRKPGCCGAGRPAGDPRRVLQALASLPPDRMLRLKQLLGADVVIVTTVRAARLEKVRR